MLIKVENFSEVLEIAFGMNALFYIFDFIPFAEEKLTALLKETEELAKKKIEVTKNGEIFPIGFVVGSFHQTQKIIFRYLTCFMSVALLGTLLWLSFIPDLR